MTPAPAVIASTVPDLRDVPFGSLSPLPPAALADVLRRILPGRDVETITPAGEFSSSI